MCPKCNMITNESLCCFEAFRAVQVRAFTGKSALAMEIRSEIRKGRIECAPQALVSTGTTRSSPIRHDPSSTGPGSQRMLDARPQSVLDADATSPCTAVPHPLAMDAPAPEGMCRRFLLLDPTL